MTDTLLGFLFPKKCVFCKKALPVDAPIGICEACAPRVPYFTGEFLFEDDGRNGGPSIAKRNYCDRIVCALEYTRFVKSAISRFKFYGRRDYGMTFAALLMEFPVLYIWQGNRS